MSDRAKTSGPANGPSESSSDEQTLVEGLAHKDPAAYVAVYDEYAPFVMTMLRAGFGYRTKAGVRRVARIESLFDAEDLLHDVFAEFFRQCERGKFDTTRPVRPYLRRIVVNRTLMHLTRGPRETPVEDIEIEYEVEDRLEIEEGRALARAFRETLSPTDLAIADAYFTEGVKSQRKVGERVGLSRDQVYRRICAIKRNAQTFFKAKGWFDGP